MSIFNDKALKGVADAVSKIMDEELKGNQTKIDANHNGKVDAQDFKMLRAKKSMKEEKAKMDYDHDGKVESPKAEVLGSRIRAAKMAGKLKEEEEQLDEKKWIAAAIKHPGALHRKLGVPEGEKIPAAKVAAAAKKGGTLGKEARLAQTLKGLKKEETELDEAFPTVADGEKSLRAKEGKTSMGTVTKTKTGLVHKRDYKDDDNDADDAQKKPKGYGARQNMGKRGQSDGTKKTMKESKLSFTEMLELYNEAGVEVISKIVPQTVKFGDTEVELIDANIVNGAVGITVAEEVDNETFTKEVEAQKEKNAGRGKKAEVAKASVQAVKQEEVEQIDEISKETAGKYLTAPQGKGANKYKVSADKVSYPDIGTMNKHATNIRRALRRSDSSSIYKKPSYYKEEEQLDEKLPVSASAGDYIHDFVHSDNPKFAGKSTKERQKMALGAFYAKNKGK